MIKKLLLVSFIYVLCSPAWAAPTYSVVYRADDRPLAQIQEAGGMWPWRTGIPDDNLLHHFEGESLTNHSSNFVSTTASLRIAVEHAAALARPNSEEPFDEDFVTYIYIIRPGIYFFDVDASLISARDRLPEDSTSRQRINTLISDYTGMEEVVAWQGFAQDRIIAYAELNGAMLQQYGVGPGSPLFSETFWLSRWMDNEAYNPLFNEDRSNSAVYTLASNPRGYVNQVENGNQTPVSLSFTCRGVNPGGSSFSQAVEDKPVCSKNQYLNVKMIIYDNKLLAALF